jgi:hypothetical protein
VSNAAHRWTREEGPANFALHFSVRSFASEIELNETPPMKWVLPVAWSCVTAAIIASGLNVTMSGGPLAAGFGYVFVLSGFAGDFSRGLALYGAAAAALGAAFALIPRKTGLQLSKGLAWSTLLLMAVGGVLMLIVPQVLVGMTVGGNEDAAALAKAWAVTWMEAGSRISAMGALMGLATFGEAILNRKPRVAASR